MSEEHLSAFPNSEFRFRRQICSGEIDVTVRLVARPSTEFAVVVDPNIAKSLYVDAVVMGIRAARDAAAPNAVLEVTITRLKTA
jgi:hypothetical protein